MYCRKCGTELQDSAKFCPKCGTPVAERADRQARQIRSGRSGSASGRPPKKPKNRILPVIIAAAAVLAALLVFLAAQNLRTLSSGTSSQAAAASGTSLSGGTAEGSADAQGETSGDGAQAQGGTADDGSGAMAESASASGAAAAAAPDEQEVHVTTLTRPSLFETVDSGAADETMPSVTSYEVASDLSNVTNLSDMYLSDAQKELLAENGFYVSSEAGAEFYEVYENNRYMRYPSFVTVDSMMHTYHLYFQYLLKNTEKNHLASSLAGVTSAMLQASLEQYGQLTGTEWEQAAARNCAFFAVASSLQGQNAELPSSIGSTVDQELQLIADHSGVAVSPLTGQNVDYSQFQVRGYYEGDETLEAYFRAMMWYGTVSFLQKEEDLSRSAVLMTLALSGDAQSEWESIYTVTRFFAGESDDLGYYEYLPAIELAYGDAVTVSNLPGNDDAWEACIASLASLDPPEINATDTVDGNSNKAFRFMGQRFSIDAKIMEELVYDSVGENSSGDMRMLPDALDVPAAFGSDAALTILTGQGATDYEGYSDNLTALRSAISGAGEETWSSNLGSRWLYTLSPLLETKGSGYPSFMQNDAWTRKNLASYLGSYTELKHDTVLYAKQVMVEMGGDIEEQDDRGYVEPEPEVFRRLSVLTEATKSGLAQFGFLDDTASEDLDLLKSLADQLQTIADKELQNELPTDEEFELIRSYGGQIEHFWYDVYKDEAGTDSFTAREFPAAVVTDIATNADGGTCLEIGTGEVGRIACIVPVDGTLRIAYGSVYSFYEFEQPISDRLTDTKWREMMGIELDDSGSYAQPQVSAPEWTQDYTFSWRDAS